MRKPPLVQERHARRSLAPRVRPSRRQRRLALALGRLAGLQGDCVRGQGSRPQGGGKPGDQVLVGNVPAQQQDLDQGPGAVTLAVDFGGLGPPGVMQRGELACEAGLFESRGARKGSRLADQGLQVVVQFEPALALRDQPLSTFWS